MTDGLTTSDGYQDEPSDRSWVAAVYGSDSDVGPLGSGVLIDGLHVLTSASFVGQARSRGLWVSFPHAKRSSLQRWPVAHVERLGDEPALLAVLRLASTVPAEVHPAALRHANAADLIGEPWWALGFSDGSPIGEPARGKVVEIVADEWMKLQTGPDPTYVLDRGFSGAGLWSPANEGVVAIIGYVDSWGDGQALSTAQVLADLPTDPGSARWAGSAVKPGVVMERASIDADLPSTVDLLGAEREAWNLARVLLARETGVPLAAALLGEWGSGKSTFMNLLAGAIDLLSEQARVTIRATGDMYSSPYLPGVRQIRFNAWHYADDHLWAGLIHHLFGELSGEPAVDDAAHQLAGEERQVLTDELAEATAELERTDAELLRAERVPTVLRALPWPLRNRRLVEDSVRTVEQARALADEARQRVRLLGPLALGLVVAGVALWALAAEAAPVWAWIGRTVAVVGSAATAAYVWWVHSIGVWRSRLGRIMGDLAGPPRPADLLALRARHDVLARRVDELKRRVAETDPERRLIRFLRERRDSSDYGAYRGLLSLVHRDLEQVSELLRREAALWKVPAGGEQPLAPPLERIVLYIDDLDRCSPDKVVEVLAAIHMILAMPLFVVVVAVDPRWLERCLSRHYADLLDDDPRAGSPIDYLEKIFQLAYVVPPMSLDDNRLARTLMERREPGSRASTLRGTPRGTTGQATGPSVGRPGGYVWEEQLAVEERQFLFNPAEVSFVESRLTSLITTPRTLKRVLNTYRVIRVSCGERQRERLLIDREHEVVLVLLAVALGHPHLAPGFFAEIRRSDADDLAMLFDGPGLTATDHQDLRRRLAATVPLSGNPAAEVERYQRWAPTVARYSFRYRDLET